MTNLGRKTKRSKLTRKVFSDSKRRKLIPLWRQLVEALLMLTVGSCIISYLNWLPQRLYAKSILISSLGELLKGIAQALSALLSIGIGILIVALALFGMVLILGALLRFTKIILKAYNSSKRI